MPSLSLTSCLQMDAEKQRKAASDTVKAAQGAEKEMETLRCGLFVLYFSRNALTGLFLPCSKDCEAAERARKLMETEQRNRDVKYVCTHRVLYECILIGMLGCSTRLNRALGEAEKYRQRLKEVQEAQRDS